MRYIKILIPVFFLYSCEKEEITKKHGNALPSFLITSWEFTDVTFEYVDEEFLDINLYHFNDSSGLVEQIVLKHISAVNDSIPLSFRAPGDHPKPLNSTAFLRVLFGLDALGESYVVDSTSDQSYVVLDCISKQKISGRFRVDFVLIDTTFNPKLAPYIPDSFSIENGKFNAARL